MIAANGQELGVLAQHQLHLPDQGQIAGHKVRIVVYVMVMLALLLQQRLVYGVLQIAVVRYQQSLCVIDRRNYR